MSISKTTSNGSRTRYPWVRDQVRREIKEGNFRPGDRLPTQYEWAKQLEVCHQTVVRALQDLVREGLIVRRRGQGTFVADRKAAPLMTGRKIKLGVLWKNSIEPRSFNTSYLGSLSLGALKHCGLERMDPIMPLVGEQDVTRAIWRSPERGVTVECLGGSWDSKVLHPPLAAVQEAGFDGLLCMSIIEEDWMEQVLALNVPLVLVDFPNERFQDRVDQVFADPLPGYRAAVRYFLKRGFKRIHFVGARIGISAPTADMSDEEWDRYKVGKKRVDPDTYLRLSAFRQAMDEAGYQIPESWIHYSPVSQKYLDPLAKTLADLPKEEQPEILICHSFPQAVLLKEACAKYGLEIEGAGSGETERAVEKVHPIRIDMKKMGALAAELLIARLQQPSRSFLNVGVKMVFDPSDAE